MTTFAVACDGGKKGETLWVSVVTFGKTAELCAQYLAKGKTVLCSGTPSLHSYTDKSGNQKTDLQMAANNVRFIGGKGDASSNAVEPF